MNPKDHSQFLIHVIFSTKHQAPFITEEVEPFLYDKISKILFDELYSPALIIGGGVEHIHIIFAQSRLLSVDGVIEIVKKRSAEFMQKKIAGFDWQKGYGAFTISRVDDEFEKKYIADQKEYHQKVSYKDEFRKILDNHEIEYDENGLWE